MDNLCVALTSFLFQDIHENDEHRKGQANMKLYARAN